jgi:hypothetical protein
MKHPVNRLIDYLCEPGKALRSVAVLVIPALLIVASVMPYSAQALTINSSRDCDNNAVIKCGALTPNEVRQKYYDTASTRTIFHNFGITHNDIDTLHSTAVEGKVTKSGRVVVNGKTVATDAITAGRQNMAGSQAETKNGVTFYKRPPSVSFLSSSLPAFVVMKDGRFSFAIIASCGNPVKATAKVPKPAPPAPTPPVPAPTTPPQAPPAPAPAPPTQTQTQSQQQTVTVVTPQPKVKKAASSSSRQTPAPKQLPNTGIGDVLGLGSFIALTTGIGNYCYKRRLLGF